MAEILMEILCLFIYFLNLSFTQTSSDFIMISIF